MSRPHGRFVIDGRAGGPLSGLRFAAKDVFDVAGHITGAGNPDWLASHAAAARHSAVVAKLLDAGATLMGKVQTDELAYSLHGDNAHYGAPINSRAPLRVTGGSSSGSAAAVAAGLVDFALGTDTGGSTRVPASYCGLWGLRTSHGLVCTDGVLPLHPSFDTVTWLARDAATFGRVAQVLLPPSGFTPRRVLRLDDAWELADKEFAPPLSRSLDTLAAQVGVPPEARTAAEGEALTSWRQVYATAGAHQGWQVRIGITQRRQAGGRRQHRHAIVSPQSANALRQDRHRGQRRGRGLVADLTGRLRTMAIACIASLAGVPQVSLPMATPAGAPLGISLLGPPGTDLALILLAVRLQAALA